MSKIEEILVWVQILEIQFLFLRLMLEISFCKAEYLKIQDYFAGTKCILDQMSGIVEVAQNSLCWIFFVREAVGDGTCNLKKGLEFMLIWLKHWSSWALWTNKFLLEEIRAFPKIKDHYWLWALPWKFGGKIN